MRKGKFGITYTFYAVLAFVLALFGLSTLSGLLLAFVIVTEKDEWATRQCMQAFFLTFVSSIASAFSSAFYSLGSSLSYTGALYSVIGVLSSVIAGIINILVLIFVIIGLVNVAKGKEANVPLLSKLAYKAFGYIPQPAPVAPAPQYGNPMQQPPQYQAPAQPQQTPYYAPAPQQPVSQVPPAPQQQAYPQTPEVPPQNQPPV
ncbi:MAG: hypothetical protein ACK5L3_06570 [Oscillospiraceae bacterium]